MTLFVRFKTYTNGNLVARVSPRFRKFTCTSFWLSSPRLFVIVSIVLSGFGGYFGFDFNTNYSYNKSLKIKDLGTSCVVL